MKLRCSLYIIGGYPSTLYISVAVPASEAPRVECSSEDPPAERQGVF